MAPTATTTTETGAWTPPASVAKALAGWTPCECGCGEDTPRRFRPGHDATLKARLIRTVLAGEKPGRSEEANRAGLRAESELRRLGWTAHLALSRSARDRRAEERRKPSPQAVSKPPRTAKTTPAPGAGERAAGTDGRVPASVAKLAGKVGRKPTGRLAALPVASK